MSFFSNLSTLFSTSDQSKRARKPQPKATDGKKPAVRPQAVIPTPSPKHQGSSSPKHQSQPQHNKPAVDVDALVREAQSKAREIIVEAKDEALAIKGKAEDEARGLRRDLEEQQRQINKQLDRVEVKLGQLDDRETALDTSREQVENLKKQLEASKNNIILELEKVSSMTTDEARSNLLENLEKKLAKEMAQMVRQKQEEAKTEADEKVREILVDSMKHGATDYVPEYTVSTVALPSEEVKGKIIGKNGRNIHAFERYTGVDVDLDSAVTEVRLSCFDPVRREVARISLERLIKDGRIQPSRIEEVVDKVRSELQKIMFEAGKKLCHDLGVYNLPPELMQMLGKFKYRFSYGQNLIAHTMEETQIGIKIAHELGADVNVVKLGCLLHDIGKVADDAEGSHVELGIAIAKKYGMPQPVIDCIAQHHEDEPFSGSEQMIVYIADAISGARPGARYENHEEYVKRLEKLEDIATSYEGVREAYAIQAGREVRVLLDPDQSKDDDVEVLALKIRDRVKAEMTYPGTVTVNVIREKRGKQVAT